MEDKRPDSALVEIIEDGYISPQTSLTRPKRNADGSLQPGFFDGGVHYSDWSICARGKHLKAGYVNVPGENPAEPVDSLAGTHLYAGVLYTHFGHFLVESTPRLWATSFFPEAESLVFINLGKKKVMPEFGSELIKKFGITTPITLINSTTKVEKLLVPDPLVDPRNLMLSGHPYVKRLARQLGVIRSESPKRVYVSRAALPLEKGAILFERQLECRLKEEGYFIFRPESSSLDEQFDIYRGAEKIIFAEGSAIHLYALVAEKKQESFIVFRRATPRLSFERQLCSFGARKPKGRPCIIRQYLQNIELGKSNKAFALIDFEALSLQLIDAGFISRDLGIFPSQEEVDVEIKRINFELNRQGRKIVGADVF